MLGATRDGSGRGQTIRLIIDFMDQSGTFVDPPSFPTITILNPSNAIILSADSNSGVEREDTGIYFYDYVIPNTAVYGTYKDVWNINVNGISFSKTLTFNIVEKTAVVAAQAGQELDPTLSETAIKNVLMLMKLLRLRLGSDGSRRKRNNLGEYLLDANGNFILEQCNVFTTEELYTFLRASLAEFNSIPHFTTYTFDDTPFVNTFQHELTEGAFILCMALQGLREKGREFQFTDDGLSYQPPTIADYIKGYLGDFLNSYRERIKYIKVSIKPMPKAINSGYSLVGAGVSPSFARLRFLRARRII